VRVERAIDLPAPAEQVWAVLMDWERQADWMRDADRIVVVSSHRIGVGVRLEVTTRLAGIPAFTESMEVVGWEPPHRFAIRHGAPVAGTGTWTLDPIGGGTRLAWTEDVRLRMPLVGSIAARCYAPLLQWLMGRSLTALRRHLVAIGPVAPTAMDQRSAPEVRSDANGSSGAVR
jgi:uncharacterized protein YndB with AHSA1/START domain